MSNHLPQPTDYGITATTLAKMLTTDQYAANLRTVFSLYDPAHVTDTFYGPTRPTAIAGVLAALSPATGWDTNQRLAETLWATDDCRHRSGVQIRKARAIKHGADPIATLNGRKETSFYLNLRGYLFTLTNDRHHMSILHGRWMSEPEAKFLGNKGVYDYFEDLTIAVAAEYGMPVALFQEALWHTWRHLLATHRTKGQPFSLTDIPTTTTN